MGLALYDATGAGQWASVRGNADDRPGSCNYIRRAGPSQCGSVCFQRMGRRKLAIRRRRRLETGHAARGGGHHQSTRLHKSRTNVLVLQSPYKPIDMCVLVFSGLDELRQRRPVY
jgi:hypothetical protein